MGIVVLVFVLGLQIVPLALGQHWQLARYDQLLLTFLTALAMLLTVGFFVLATVPGWDYP